jgi:2'-5' RNA ligase
MKQQCLSFPNNEWHYLFLASPERNLANRVMEVKEDFYYSYGHKIAIDTWPHITLAAFRSTNEAEPFLIALLQQACARYRKFSTPLQEFDGFEGFNKSAIYIKVEAHQPFLHMAKGLCVIKGLLLSNGCSSAYLVNRPHLTVAKWIPYLMYLEAMEDYRHKRFRDSFLVNSLLLLKKQNEEDKYQRVTTIRLF